MNLCATSNTTPLTTNPHSAPTSKAPLPPHTAPPTPGTPPTCNSEPRPQTKPLPETSHTTNSTAFPGAKDPVRPTQICTTLGEKTWPPLQTPPILQTSQPFGTGELNRWSRPVTPRRSIRELAQSLARECTAALQPDETGIT